MKLRDPVHSETKCPKWSLLRKNKLKKSKRGRQSKINGRFDGPCYYNLSVRACLGGLGREKEIGGLNGSKGKRYRVIHHENGVA